VTLHSEINCLGGRNENPPPGPFARRAVLANAHGFERFVGASTGSFAAEISAASGAFGASVSAIAAVGFTVRNLVTRACTCAVPVVLWFGTVAAAESATANGPLGQAYDAGIDGDAWVDISSRRVNAGPNVAGRAFGTGDDVASVLLRAPCV